MKISARLNHLFDQIIFNHQQQNYEHIWDLCCDHGLLGMKLFHHTQQTNIHLLDQVKKILDVLEHKYAKFNDGRIEFKCQDAKTIKLPIEQKHMIVIAGVGGETLIEIMDAIIRQNPKAQMDFTLSPNSHLYEVRSFLRENFTLIEECLLKEGNRFHEHLVVRYSPNCQPTISLTGEKFWQTSDLAKDYQQKLIKHYDLISTYHDHPISQKALEAYSALAL